VLRELKIRSTGVYPIVFIAAFDHLSHLLLDMCTIQVVVAEIKTQGMFFIKRTKQGSLRAFIVLNKMLYNNPKQEMRELLKIAGVHEFVHFLAIVYSLTAYNTSDIRESLILKLEGKIMKLPGRELLTLYDGLRGRILSDKVPEFTDIHFRLGYEGDTPDYYLLFLHLMFSRELFEEYFNEPKQRQFRDYFKNDNTQAIQLLVESLNVAAKDKDVPVSLALTQLMEWAHVYTRSLK